MSRIENNKFEINMTYFDVRQAIKEVCNIMEFQANQKKILLLLEIDEKVPSFIHTDKKRYRQILFNLIGNALKFTFEGHVQVKLYCDGANLMTEVIDTGIGINSKDL